MAARPHFGDRSLPLHFWSKVRILSTGCWEWTAYCNNGGYGRFGVGSRTDGSRKKVSAHRLIYEVLVKPIPKWLDTDHLCHNRDLNCQGGKDCKHRRCVNYTHIEPATRAVNSQRGRRSKGETNGMSKLKREDIHVIRSLSGKMLQSDLAVRFGVTQGNISGIQRKTRWTHI